MSTRDKELTKKKLLQAVSTLLLDGSEEIGINRVAESAGVDKVLIYRYFRGLPGLLSTFARETPVWPEFEEIMEAAPYVAAMLKPEEVGARFVHGFIRELLDRSVTQEILRWELLRENDLTRETANLREQCLQELTECFDSDRRGRSPDLPGTPAAEQEDVTALYALITAGLLYLMLHAKTSERFCAIPLRTPEGWARIERAATKALQSK